MRRRENLGHQYQVPSKARWFNKETRAHEFPNIQFYLEQEFKSLKVDPRYWCIFFMSLVILKHEERDGCSLEEMPIDCWLTSTFCRPIGEHVGSAGQLWA